MWVKNQLAPYKYPRVISMLIKLPRTVNGKIRPRHHPRGEDRGGGEGRRRAAWPKKRRRACITLLRSFRLCYFWQAK